MSVAARVAEEMGVKLGNEVRAGASGGNLIILWAPIIIISTVL
jgi:hypothetical protein